MSSIGYWDVVHLDETGEKFACQRSPIFGDAEFETIGPFDSFEAASDFCDGLNESVPDEIDSIPDYGRAS